MDKRILRRLPMIVTKNQTKSNWDRIGIGVSGLCLIHCLFLPALILIVPAIGTLFVDDMTHVILYSMIVVSAVASFIPGYQLHRQFLPIICAVIGFLFISFATFLAHPWLGHKWEAPIAICGSSVLILAHWLNHRSKHQCLKCNHH